MGIRDLRSGPIGAQKHADRHVALPERHWFAENADLQAFHVLQVSGGGEPIRASTQDYDVTIFHSR